MGVTCLPEIGLEKSTLVGEAIASRSPSRARRLRPAYLV